MTVHHPHPQAQYMAPQYMVLLLQTAQFIAAPHHRLALVMTAHHPHPQALAPQSHPRSHAHTVDALPLPPNPEIPFRVRVLQVSPLVALVLAVAPRLVVAVLPEIILRMEIILRAVITLCLQWVSLTTPTNLSSPDILSNLAILTMGTNLLPRKAAPPLVVAHLLVAAQIVAFHLVSPLLLLLAVETCARSSLQAAYPPVLPQVHRPALSKGWWY